MRAVRERYMEAKKQRDVSDKREVCRGSSMGSADLMNLVFVDQHILLESFQSACHCRRLSGKLAEPFDCVPELDTHLCP